MSISRYHLAHAYLFYIRCSFLLGMIELSAKIRISAELSVKFNYFLYITPKIFYKCLANRYYMLPLNCGFSFVYECFAHS